jgi:RNA polymerase sigma-70 factor, ECF subfamily
MPGMCNEAPGRYTSSHGISPYPRAMEDAALARAIAGAGTAIDAAAEAELCRRFAPRVRLYGLRHLRDPHAAADLAQQVLMMTLERLRAGKLREPERLASFVLGMSRMLVMDLRRGSARREALLETWVPAYAGMTEGEAVEDAEPRVFERERLVACLDGLSERERSVVVASFFDEKPAAELGLSAGNLRVIRHRALGKLRGCMEGA